MSAQSPWAKECHKSGCQTLLHGLRNAEHCGSGGRCAVQALRRNVALFTDDYARLAKLLEWIERDRREPDKVWLYANEARLVAGRLVPLPYPEQGSWEGGFEEGWQKGHGRGRAEALREVEEALERAYHPQNPTPDHPADFIRRSRAGGER